jgi:O-antigen ligase
MKLYLKKDSLITLSSFLIVLLPFFLITGPFLSDLSIVLISLVFLFKSLKEKKFHYYKSFFFKFFLCFWLYLLINSLLQYPDLSSLKKTLPYIRFGLFALSIWYFIELDNNLLKNLFLSFCFCFFILVVDGFIQFYFEKNLFGYALSEEGRISSFFKDELIFGSYLSRLFPILFGLSIFLKLNKKTFFALCLLFVLVESLTFVSGERSAFFYINLSAVFMIIMLKGIKVLRLSIWLSSFIVIIFIASVSDSSRYRMIDHTFEQIGLSQKGDKKYIFSEQHQDHYISALKMFKENIFFGVGVKNFRIYCSDEKYYVSELSCSTHPHNTYIQFLAETGFLGFIFILTVFLFFTFHCIKDFYFQIKKKVYFDNFEVCLLSAILITIWPVAPSGSFFNNYLSIIYYFPVGIFLWKIKDRNFKLL